MGERQKERILILGAGVMQGPALKIAKEMGLETVAADVDGRAPSIPLADRFERVDLKDKEGIEALARSLMEDGGLAGIMTAGTDFSATAAWAAERLGLPGIPYETALDASDKERMRRRFRAAGVPSPEFIILNGSPPPDFSLPFSWPAVVKPVDNMGSRGCRRVDNFAELRDALADALKFSRSRRAIVEEYMEGPEFSVDALVYSGEITICGLADRHIFFPPYFIEMGHTMPTDLPLEKARALLEVFKAGVRALGIDNGAAKGDIKLTPKGPMIGEIAARLSGGYMSGWTYPYASGVLPTRGAIQICLGKKPDRLEPEKTWTCAERAFISIPGKVLSIHGIDEASSIPGVKDLFLRIEQGSSVIFPENNVTKCGNVISAAAGREEAVRSAEEAARAVLIRLEAPNRATAAFLAAFPQEAAWGAFPPDAFPLDGELLSLLEALEEGSPAGKKGEPALLPFPALVSSDLRDYMGRGVEESLAAVRRLSGLTLPPALPGEDRPLLGRGFWAALVRGGYQGALYYIDCLGLVP
ncbi:MAG: ATP-grasp domain-containing protein [Treponema sp.]|jgi:biotin carboxylase|nr:ATP-grasp domain-containing protein [Treponema sp.]